MRPGRRTPRKKPAAVLPEAPKPAEEPLDDAKLLSPSKSKFVGRRTRFGWFYRLFGDKHMAIAWSVLVVILTFSLANLFLL
uniref:ABC transporter ATP-binding protein n=1 Tax=Steinernema glaseri TaxID=37863 RepID=A0A1I8AM84_9BILA